METIEVRYAKVMAGRYHKYIVYTDANGKSFAARGGSADGGPSSGWSFPPGDITTVHGPFDGNFPDPPNDTDPRETITEGDDLSKEWERNSVPSSFLLNIRKEIRLRPHFLLSRVLLSAIAALSVSCLSPYTSSADTPQAQHEAVRNAGSKVKQPAYEGLILHIYNKDRPQKVNGGMRVYIRPVLLVKAGQYVNPDAEVSKVGLKQFTDRWLKGKRFAVYGDGGRAGYLGNLSLVRKEESSGDRKLLTGQATLIERNGGHATLTEDRMVKGTSAVKRKSETRQFVGRPLAIDEASGAAAEALLAPLANPDPPVTAELIQSFIGDVNIKKLASELEHRLLTRGGAAEGAKILERREPWLIAHLDVDGNGLPDTIGNFGLLVERNGQTFVFGELFIRYDSGSAEAIHPISDHKDRAEDIILDSFIRTSNERKATDLLVYVTWTRAYGSYAILTRKASGWVMEQL